MVYVVWACLVLASVVGVYVLMACGDDVYLVGGHLVVFQFLILI